MVQLIFQTLLTIFYCVLLHAPILSIISALIGLVQCETHKDKDDIHAVYCAYVYNT